MRKTGYFAICSVIFIFLFTSCGNLFDTGEKRIELDFNQSVFGPNVHIFDNNSSDREIQTKIDNVYSIQKDNQFGEERDAFFFKPGVYNLDLPVGFYTSVYGIGKSPDDVDITGTSIYSEAFLSNNNSTCNFWRSVENISVTPSDGTMQWAVSQASPFRRVHVKGDMALHQDGGWASGGLIADSIIDGNVIPGSQQQWYSRNSEFRRWSGSLWNYVFQGTVNAPEDNWVTDSHYTTIDTTPVIREKPYLYIDGNGDYFVFVPELTNSSSGSTWSSGDTAGTSLPISDFHIVREDVDSASTINQALALGKHLLITPGYYHLEETIRISHAGTIILGLGFATLVPTGGFNAMEVSDVSGVILAGLLFEAGPVSSPKLLEVGPTGNGFDHSDNPISLHDLVFRIGGYVLGKAETAIEINSNSVIGDHFWVWRADHGDDTYDTVGWDVNTSDYGLVVNGDDVTIYGLFVEHFQKYNTLWNGENGRTYFYQCELPYDVPSQSAWMDGFSKGYAGYKVLDSVNVHEAWGLGIYSVFTLAGIQLESAISAPQKPGVKFHHMVTTDLNQGVDNIIHIINDMGDSVGDGGNFISRWEEY